MIYRYFGTPRAFDSDPRCFWIEECWFECQVTFFFVMMKCISLFYMYVYNSQRYTKSGCWWKKKTHWEDNTVISFSLEFVIFIFFTTVFPFQCMQISLRSQAGIFQVSAIPVLFFLISFITVWYYICHFKIYIKNTKYTYLFIISHPLLEC